MTEGWKHSGKIYICYIHDRRLVNKILSGKCRGWSGDLSWGTNSPQKIFWALGYEKKNSESHGSVTDRFVLILLSFLKHV